MIDIEVQGLIELQEKAEKMVAAMHGAPILNAMRDSTLLIEGKAKQNAPVDTGRLRASITPKVESGADVVTGVVGSNVEYAPWMEFGTGTFAGRPPHKIGLEGAIALAAWARRKGIANRTATGVSELSIGILIALGIEKRGGLKPRLYLTKAFEDSQTAIVRRFNQALDEVVNL